MKHVFPEFIAGLSEFFGDDEYTVRSIALFFLVVMGVVVTSFLGIDAYLKNDSLLATIDFLATVVFLTFLYLLVKNKEPYIVINVGAYFVAIFFFFLLVYGGSNNTGFFWFFIFPVISCFFLGSTHGGIVSSILGGAAFLYFVWGPNNVGLGFAHYSSDFSVRFLFCYFTVTAFALISEMLRERHRDKLIGAKLDLEAQVVERTRELQDRNLELKRVATTDALTGVYNRLKLNELLKYEFLQAHRYNKAFCLILMDVDHFKNVNDEYGHLVGDSILAELCALVLDNCRESDSFGRWGGEEFLLISPLTDIEAGYLLAEKFRTLVSTHSFPDIDSLTISCGVACYSGESSENEIVRKADEALYLAKNKRNVTVSASLFKAV